MNRRPTSIRRYLLQRTLLFSAIGFLLLLVVAGQAYNSSIRANAEQVARSVAQSTFNAMYLIMSQGWTRQQLEQFIGRLEEANDEEQLKVSIYRGPLVTELFGPIRQPALDTELQQVLGHGEVARHTADDNLRYLYPLRAEKTCQACHTNARIGDTLGVIEVQQDLKEQFRSANRTLLHYLLLLSPLPLLFAFWAVRKVTTRVNRSVEHLSNSIRQVESLSDLPQLALRDRDFGFRELNRIFTQVAQLSDKLRTIAVDKDLLEFEIRLLEKFVITSEVVRDWREYVQVLMQDISQVLKIYTMFSIFKVDDEMFDLEIFWHGQPTPETRQMMEDAVLKRLRDSNSPFCISEFQVHHNITQADHPLELAASQIELQTKSLLVETPKIGGIVGIGVQADIVKDATRVLVLESILSTLLNVVGSVKAIYKYTRDLEYYATRDPLTNLYNQRMFWELLEYELDRCERHGYKVALLMLDLDNFKAINDGYGHACGDQLLTELSAVLQQQLRTGDVLARYGGDEFVVILPEASLEVAAETSERILAATQDFGMQRDNGVTVRVTSSIGVGLYPDHARNRKDLFMFVDNLMYRSKSLGKDRISLPHEQDLADIFRDLNRKSLLVSEAIENRSVIPAFQPIMPNADGEPMAVEVLCRIRLPDERLMSAGEFIELAESMGKVHQLDYVVMEKAFEAVQRSGYDGLLFINLSPRSILIDDFLRRIRTLTRTYAIHNERIVFEITERDTVKSMATLEKFVSCLKDSGFKFAIDDFGSGFSSFHYLKHLPIDFVKIEGEFIANMANDSRDLAFVTSITRLAGELKVRTVAEFVESAEILEQVRAIGIDYAQGYHIGHPTLSLEELVGDLRT